MTSRRRLKPSQALNAKNRSDLDALIVASQEPDLERRFTAMERVLDVDRFATFLALEVMLNHWDGYSLHLNNYRVFHDNSSGKLIFMPHGMDQLFGLRRREFDPQVLPAMSGLAARVFMETRAGRRLYLDRMAQLQTNVFDVPTLIALVDKLTDLLRPVLQSDPGALAEFNSRVPVLRQRLADRRAEIHEQLADMRTPPFDAMGEASLAALNFKSAVGKVSISVAAGFDRSSSQSTAEFLVPGAPWFCWRAANIGSKRRVRARIDRARGSTRMQSVFVALRVALCGTSGQERTG